MTRDELVRLRQRLLDGETRAALAAEVGISAELLNYYWKSRGLIESMPHPKGHRELWTYPRLRRLHARWCAGVSLSELAKAEGVGRDAIWHAFKAHGIETPDYVTNRTRYMRSASEQVAVNRSLALAAAMRRDGALWKHIHAECVRRFGYPMSLETLRRRASQYWQRVTYNQVRGSSLGAK